MNDPLLDGVMRDRLREQNRLESNSFFLQMQANAQQQAEQEAFLKNLAIVLILGTVGGSVLYWLKNQQKSKESSQQKQ